MENTCNSKVMSLIENLNNYFNHSNDSDYPVSTDTVMIVLSAKTLKKKKKKVC